MPEHVHVVVYPGEVPELTSRFLQAVKEPVARKAIHYLKNVAPAWLARVTVREGQRLRHRFWQPGGGYDRNVTSIQSLRAMIDYLHANPVRRGLVARAEDWEWSSALVCGDAACEAGNGPGRASGAGPCVKSLSLQHALRSTSGRATRRRAQKWHTPSETQRNYYEEKGLGRQGGVPLGL